MTLVHSNIEELAAMPSALKFLSAFTYVVDVNRHHFFSVAKQIAQAFRNTCRLSRTRYFLHLIRISDFSIPTHAHNLYILKEKRLDREKRNLFVAISSRFIYYLSPYYYSDEEKFY